MEVKILEPLNELVKQYVESIYIFERSEEAYRYVAYPSLHTAIGLFRNADVICKELDVTIRTSNEECYHALAGNRLHNVTSIYYADMPEEIAINFRPFGFTLFTGGLPLKDNFSFHYWDADLKELFTKVFATTDYNQRLYEIEQFLLGKYNPFDETKILNKAIGLLCDFSHEYSLQEIADITGLHYKQLARLFSKYIGCSAVHFRKIARFRNSLQARLKKKNTRSYTEICYEHNFTDQSYFIKQFRELTGENPRMFFKDIRSFSEEYIVWKFM